MVCNRDLVKTYDRFVKPGSPEELNLDVEVSRSVGEAMHQLKSKYDPELAATVFVKAQEQIFKLMQMDSLPSYLTSPGYQEARQLVQKIRGSSAVSTAVTLSECDWEVLRTAGVEKEFLQGEIIIPSHEPHQYMYILLEGEILCRTAPESGNVVLPPVSKQGTLFGELSLFKKLPFFVAAVANSNVRVHQMHIGFLFQLFEAKPLLGVRLYNFIGNHLASTITMLTKHIVNDDSPVEGSRMNMAHAARSKPLRESSDLLFRKHFPVLLNDERLIVSHECSMPRSVIRRASMFISQHYLLYVGVIFGQKSKVRRPFDPPSGTDGHGRL